MGEDLIPSWIKTIREHLNDQSSDCWELLN